MRFLNRDLFLCFFGSPINIAAILLDFAPTFSIMASQDIFCNALIIAYLSWVSSTLPASAKYSFFLEIARLMRGKRISESKYSANHSIGRGFFLPLVLMRIYPIVPIAPINTLMMTIFFTSPLMMWVSSWPATASISLSLSFSNIPLEKTIQEFFGLRPVAKALRLLSLMIPIFGIGKPLEIQRFSIILYAFGASFLLTSLAPVKPKIIFFWKKIPINIHTARMMIHMPLKEVNACQNSSLIVPYQK